jgi:hypothetical protein
MNIKGNVVYCHDSLSAAGICCTQIANVEVIHYGIKSEKMTVKQVLSGTSTGKALPLLIPKSMSTNSSKFCPSHIVAS